MQGMAVGLMHPASYPFLTLPSAWSILALCPNLGESLNGFRIAPPSYAD